MKTLFLFLFTTVCFTGYGQELNNFSWLEGTWLRQGSNDIKKGYESWSMEQDTYNGLGITIQDSDTTFIEHLKIEKKEGKFFYVANVAHNKTPIYFEITSCSNNHFIAENPDHDFPRKIEYQLSGDAFMATISADEKEVKFVFHRVNE